MVVYSIAVYVDKSQKLFETVFGTLLSSFHPDSALVKLKQL